ncbi:MAG: HAD-IA family hydrolase [Kineosporiaceae bacterium]|nr:HAD-IA family hydrolase [Kineosporiaceae bacterium]
MGEVGRRRFAAVLFDLDGTLIDSTSAVVGSWHLWALERGLPGMPIEIPHGVPARQVLAGLVPAEEIESAFARIEALEIGQLDGITVLPGAVDALAAVPADRAAIVTSGTPPLVRARLGVTGLPAPPLVITPDDVPRGKPDPAPYRLAAERLGLDPRDCLVVEDAGAGLTSGRAAGCTTLALTTTHTAGELVHYAPDALIGCLADVRLEVVDGAVRVVPAG